MTALTQALPIPAEAALFLDFDGTLVDLAATPDAVQVAPDLPPLLDALTAATDGALAIVSGRAIADLEGFLPEFRGPLVGGHGAEWRIAGEVHRHDVAGSEALESAQEAMVSFAEDHPGRLFEPKPTGGVLHYRQDPAQEDVVTDFVTELAACTPGLEHHGAKMAEELRPEGIGKEHAVAKLMETSPFAQRTGVFFGDDATDEPAMAWLLSRGGAAVKLGAGETCAPLRLDSPAMLREGLAAWLRA